MSTRTTDAVLEAMNALEEMGYSSTAENLSSALDALLDAEKYIAFILSLEVWGHGPVQVSEAIQKALDWNGLPDDAIAWLEQKEGNVKKEEGKHEPHMVYQSAIAAISLVRMYGVKKHGSEDGWKTTTVMRHLDAARRHLDETIESVRNGDESRLWDVESGQLHMAHAMCNIMFEIERIAEEARNRASGAALDRRYMERIAEEGGIL